MTIDRRKVHEGKAKIVWDAWPAAGAAGPAVPGATDAGASAGVASDLPPDSYVVEYKDDATAFDGKKRGQIGGKGRINNLLSAMFFEFLEREGIPTHYLKTISDREMLVRKLNIIQVEVVVRNVAAGSLAKRLGLEEGAQLDRTVLEHYYKSDELGDPLINRYHIRTLDLATDDEMDAIERMALRVNDILGQALIQCGLRLIDFKLEFGRTASGDILLGDEISPDTCRFWDLRSGEKLDKDRFRRDLGGVEEAYEEVLRRVSAVAGNWRGVTAGQSTGAAARGGAPAVARSAGAARTKARVFVTLKSTVLDPQGAAVQKALESMGYDEVADVRVGKFITLDLQGASPEELRERIDDMSRRLLANPVIEDYHFELVREGEKGR